MCRCVPSVRIICISIQTCSSQTVHKLGKNVLCITNIHWAKLALCYNYGHFTTFSTLQQIFKYVYIIIAIIAIQNVWDKWCFKVWTEFNRSYENVCRLWIIGCVSRWFPDFLWWFIISEQAEIKSQLVLDDCEDWSTHLRDAGASHTPIAAQGEQTTHLLTHIGGVDISFIKGDKLNACAALVIVSFHDLEVIHNIIITLFIVHCCQSTNIIIIISVHAGDLFSCYIQNYFLLFQIMKWV